MAIAYQYTAEGYFAGPVEDYGLLPHNATPVQPVFTEGHVPCWNGSAWEQAEDHKGKQGYVNGAPFTIAAYGSLPEGWRETPPPPTEAEQRATLITAIQAHLDAFARARNYDSAMACASYATSANPTFAKEAQYMVAARDAVWEAGFKVLDEAFSGKRPVPSVEELLAELPILNWPA
ncbi:hypothetical protein [Desulfovibrio cuneatus]|uniref:hypothetical protein n=1 Tax=Desulfovibrio cuneatus TaxID=159728 RepID=UPI000419CF46|nr:hypothetical protein [Desulfovibrio cuneatus]